MHSKYTFLLCMILASTCPLFGDIVPGLNIFQSIPTSGAANWESFTIGADSYLAVANQQDDSSTSIDSKIYKFNGTSFVEFQTMPTFLASDWIFFTMGSDSYLAGCKNSTSLIDLYRFNGTSFVEFQDIPAGGYDWEFFTIGADSYIAVSEPADSGGSSTWVGSTTILKFDGTSFVEFDVIIDGSGCEFFTIGSDSYIAIARVSGPIPFESLESVIYKFDGTSFVEFQTVPVGGADWEFFTIDADSYLAFASGWGVADSKIYKFNGTSFADFQTIPTTYASDWEFFTVGNDSYLSLACSYGADSKVYKFDGTSFIEFQSIPTSDAVDWEIFTIDGATYAAVANWYNGYTFDVDSTVYKWYSCVGSFDSDCDVDNLDFAIFAAAWLAQDDQPEWNPDCNIGLSADDVIDIGDLAVFADHWLDGR